MPRRRKRLKRAVGRRGGGLARDVWPGLEETTMVFSKRGSAVFIHTDEIKKALENGLG